VIEADVLELDLAEIACAPSFNVYGNIPYYITSPILHRIFDASTNHPGAVLSAHLVMQLEVATRLIARPGKHASGKEYGYLSAATQFHSKPELLMKIPAGAFRPQPKVASALVKLSFPGEGVNLHVTNPGAFLNFVQRCFAQKRKTLMNNLRGMRLTPRSGEDRDNIRSAGGAAAKSLLEIMDESGIEAGARAEQLTLVQFAALYRALEKD
jgi:16S rRNA (adenine1518-N6/adenine1519-N6)-dimethyltransferase